MKGLVEFNVPIRKSSGILFWLMIRCISAISSLTDDQDQFAFCTTGGILEGVGLYVTFSFFLGRLRGTGVNRVLESSPLCLYE